MKEVYRYLKLSVDEVFKTLKTIDTSKATGADSIPAKILKVATGPCQAFLHH